jgi:hypothetical protein
VLEVQYDGKRNIRPWDKTLFIRVIRGFLREGDTITVRFGDRSKGSPGMRVQTFSEPTFEFRVLVDPFATYHYTALPIQPVISVVAGPPVLWKAVVPTLRQCGQRFRLGFKGEDKWGNPSDQVEGTFTLRSSHPINGLPAEFSMKPGEHAEGKPRGERFKAILRDLQAMVAGEESPPATAAPSTARTWAKRTSSRACVKSGPSSAAKATAA